MRKQQLLVNAFVSILQVVVVAGALFILYRFLLHTLGIDQLGVWSLVLATMGVAQISELGLSASTVKFVAKYQALGEKQTVAELLETAILSVGTITALLLLLAYPFTRWILGRIVPAAQLSLALDILPYALVSLWLTQVTGVFQSGLDGVQRIDLRNAILIFSALCHLLFSFVLTPVYGLAGLAWAYVLQAGVALAGSWVLLRWQIKGLAVIPHRWNRRLFREMLGYAVNFQVVSVARMLYDPTTKALLSRFGGLAAVGYYEMASRLVRQLRSVIISANQVIVPAVADLQERSPGTLASVYRDSYRLLFYISLPLYSIVVVLAPAISEIWIGRRESVFVLFTVLLAAGWFVNTLNGPSYFSNLGTGKLYWNTVSHVGIAVLNAILGFLFGRLYGPNGVVAAWVFSLAVGSLVVVVQYHLKHQIPLRELVPGESLAMVLSSVAGMLVARALYNHLHSAWNVIAVTAAVLASFSVIVVLPAWLHPMRRRLLGWIIRYALQAENTVGNA